MKISKLTIPSIIAVVVLTAIIWIAIATFLNVGLWLSLTIWGIVSFFEIPWLNGYRWRRLRAN